MDPEQIISDPQHCTVIPLFSPTLLSYLFLIVATQELGMEKVGARKKLMDSQAAIHKTEWERGSLPKLTYQDRTAGLRYSAALPGHQVSRLVA